MKNTVSTTLKAGIAALALLAASGCVSQKAVDEIKATADKAVQDAAAAKAYICIEPAFYLALPCRSHRK